ncbi:hypothetical protein K9M79_07370 [Candidatus Woesearchaeota archaeon]|nr:hypothetical protein [Candidatus Woesearchaeota archaeon]
MPVEKINLRLFIKPEEDEDKLQQALFQLMDFDITKEKINEMTAKGFNERNIKIFEVQLSKKKNVRSFLRCLLLKLDDSEKEKLMSQAESRLDEANNFFLRLDKDALLKGRYVITDCGECFHIRLDIVTFPKNRDKALQEIRELLVSAD